MSKLTPITRDEKFLNGAAQGSVEGLPVPILREEKYLAKAAGMDLDALGIEIPEPEIRVEEYLNALAEGGGGIHPARSLPAQVEILARQHIA